MLIPHGIPVDKMRIDKVGSDVETLLESGGVTVAGAGTVGIDSSSQGIVRVGQDRIGVSSTDSVTKVVDSAKGVSEQGRMRIGVDRIGISPEVVSLNTKQLIENPPASGVPSNIKVNGAGLVTSTGAHEVEILTDVDAKISSISTVGEKGVKVVLPESATDGNRVLAFTAVAVIVGGGVILSSDEMAHQIRDAVPCVGDILQGCEVLDIEVTEPDTSSLVGINEEIVNIPGKVSTGTPNLKQPVSFSASKTKIAGTLSSITGSVAAKNNFAGKSFVTQLSGNEKRDVEFYVPMGVDFAKPVNVVYLFHGLGDVERIAKVTLPNGILAVESSPNTILVYPVSAGNRGTGGGDGEWMKAGTGQNSISSLHANALNVLAEMSPVDLKVGNVNVVCHSAGGQACRNIVSSGGLQNTKTKENIPVDYYMADSCYGNWCGAVVKGSRSVDTVAVRYNNQGVTGTKNGGELAAKAALEKLEGVKAALERPKGQISVHGVDKQHLDFILDTANIIASHAES